MPNLRHWSLTQFTPCTNDIAPANAVERIFASFVSIFALIVFSAFLSSLTTAIMEMKKLNFERFKEEMQIRDFLHGKEVPLTLANRIWHYYRRHYRRRSKLVAEADVPLFMVMPKSLRKELRNYSYSPTLVKHPIINELVEGDETLGLRQCLCEVVSTLIPISGQDIFVETEQASQMYYFVNGRGLYTCKSEMKNVSSPDYISDAVLWLRAWNHLGRLTATNHRCELLLLNTVNFISCIEKVLSEATIRGLRKYASLFAQRLSEMANVKESGSKSGAALCIHVPQPVQELSDLPLEEDVQNKMMEKAFAFHRARSNSQSSQDVRRGHKRFPTLGWIWRRQGSKESGGSKGS